MKNLLHFEGHVSPGHALNPLHSMDELGKLGRMLTHYQATDLWELDTQRLPAPLAKLRRHCRQFAEQFMAPNVQKLDEAPHTEPGTLHPAALHLLKHAGRAGLMTNLLPAPLGSATMLDLRFPTAFRFAIQVEELARVCGGQMLLLSAHQLGLAPICLSGDLRAIWKFVRPMTQDFIKGIPHLFAYAITEPAAGSDVEDGHGALANQPRVIAKRQGRGYIINGRKCFISGGDVARHISVFAALEGEGFESWTCFVVSADNPGLESLRTELKMGMRASSAAELSFTDCYVPADAMVGGLRQGWALNRATLNSSRYPVAAMAVGMARRACELALEYCLQTQLGGKPLLSYQEYQLQLAQMIAETRAMRALVWQQASGSLQSHQAEASLSKFFATDRAQAVCEMGMALLAEHGLHNHEGMEKLLRDIRLTRIFEGTNQINRLAVIEDLQPLLLDRLAGQRDTVSV
ncbi:MAG: acyl-CoA dehydrogenase [Pseudomonadales bacterium]|nr:acyl-CoA dehydrogenase [Pseudomonadales bacterium]